MAPKASAPAHLVITRVKGPPKISQDGSAVVVKKTLSDGATVEEKFPKRRARGKQKQPKQLIPTEDVLRAIEEAAHIAAGAARGEGEAKVQAVSAMANQVLDEQKRKYDTLEQNASARADRQIKKAVKVAAAARAQTSKAKERARQAMSFAEAIAQHMNA
jgi:hypothetical protein